MEKAVVVLPAEEGHIPGIISVWKELMDFHAEIDPFYSRSADGHVHFIKLIRDCIYSETAYIVVALHGEKVVGYGTCQIHSFPPVFKEKWC
ncbi:MAG: hypothetical protein HXS47_11820 [Theionarchaea archaeon]|nr:hypothetical protein [Theionarchaea archaeon]